DRRFGDRFAADVPGGDDERVFEVFFEFEVRDRADGCRAVGGLDFARGRALQLVLGFLLRDDFVFQQEFVLRLAPFGGDRRFQGRAATGHVTDGDAGD